MSKLPFQIGHVGVPPIKCQGIKTKLVPFIFSSLQWEGRGGTRWVEDRNRWTSSGVAAGMDMTLALMAKLHTEDVAAAVADGVELDWHRDPTWDPFAVKNGLIAE